MPLLILPLVILLVITVSVLILPWSIVQRYRAGTSRRSARGWVTLLNVAGMSFSAAIFLASAAAISFWVPGAFTYSMTGFAAGGALGLLGLWLTSWERNRDALHYTPNRWLVLAITLIVGVRLCYGLWRTWQVWQTGHPSESWVEASGFANSLAAGALVLGYYTVFWTGVWRFAKRHMETRKRKRWILV